MKTITEGNYRFSTPKIAKNTKLWLLTGNKQEIEYKWSRNVDGADYFQNVNCLKKYKNRHKSKAYVKTEGGKIIVKEGKHYLTCQPYEIDLELNDSNTLLARYVLKISWTCNMLIF